MSSLQQDFLKSIQTTHNSQHEPPPSYPLAALALSLHGNIRMDSNLGSAASYVSIDGTMRWVLGVLLPLS